MKIRCYLPSDKWEGEVRLSGPEARHLTQVLRVSPGDEIVCFDGQGQEAEAVVRQVGRREVELALGRRRTVPQEAWKVTLAAAVPGGGKFEQIIDQATQMGVSRIVPLACERGVVRISPSEAGKKLVRWRQVAVAAGKQSGSSRLPEIEPMTPWKQFLPAIEKGDRALIAALEGPYADPGTILSPGKGGSLLILIGPEGDFTPEEMAQADEQGAKRIWLGPTVLRCETAVVAALAIISHHLHETV